MYLAFSYQISGAQNQPQVPNNGAPEGFVFDEQGRIVSGTEPKKTRIYIGIDKSDSMDVYYHFISDGARSLVQGLSERACADWEVVVYEIGSYDHKGTFIDVDFVASIIITDTLINHEPLLGSVVANQIQKLIGKPFKSWSFSVFPENISQQCFADILGGDNERLNADYKYFLEDCLINLIGQFE